MRVYTILGTQLALLLASVAYSQVAASGTDGTLNIELAATFADFRALRQLPQVKLGATSQISQQGDRQLARIRLRNESASLAFFVKLNLTSCGDGKEILPVLWSDNYVSLLPGETHELTASFRATHPSPVRVEIAGWNVSQLSVGCRWPSRVYVRT